MTVLTSEFALSPLLVPVPNRVVNKIDESPGVVTLHVVPVEGELLAF